jgi:hypothetical protein
MEKLESKQEKLKTMPCESTEKTIPELEKDGWEYDWSFHVKFSEQWNQACERVEKANTIGLWECVLVQG